MIGVLFFRLELLFASEGHMSSPAVCMANEDGEWQLSMYYAGKETAAKEGGSGAQESRKKERDPK